MIYILDTNIVLFSLLRKSFKDNFESIYWQRENTLMISAVTEGELRALSLKRQWGRTRHRNLEAILKKFIIYPVKTEAIMREYARVDAYSQGKLPDRQPPKGLSARNMGKNDIWIAATASVNQGTLVTTDKDFDHLNNIFFPLDYLDIQQF